MNRRAAANFTPFDSDDLRSQAGKRIAAVRVRDNRLVLEFDDGSALEIWDAECKCCETRHMTCDDDLSYFVGATFLGAQVVGAESQVFDCDDPDYDDKRGTHDQQFLDVRTSKGVFTAVNHNEHNGCYAGFEMETRVLHS